jgi:hypothetical protein
LKNEFEELAQLLVSKIVANLARGKLLDESVETVKEALLAVYTDGCNAQLCRGDHECLN